MSELKIVNFKVSEENIKKSKELDDIIKLMIKYGNKDPLNMLPQTPWHTVSFELHNTSSSFANGIRRTLIEELPVKCLSFEEKSFQTDDEFILSDVLMKNINLIPIKQEIDLEELSDLNIFLYKYNDTNDIIDVKASDIKIAKKEKKKSDETKESKSKIPLAMLIPESNITVVSLRPGKFIKLISLILISGTSKKDAAKFSLLDNVKYYPIDMEPYDVLKGTGTRSIEYDPKNFYISFTTTGNILPQTVIKLLSNVLTEKLKKCKGKLSEYISNISEEEPKKYYFTEGLEVSTSDQITTYKFIGEYITIAYMLAQRCYLLDANILYCTPAIDRYDNEIAMVKLKHASPNKLLMQSMEKCLKDVELLESTLLEHF